MLPPAQPPLDNQATWGSWQGADPPSALPCCSPFAGAQQAPAPQSSCARVGEIPPCDDAWKPRREGGSCQGPAAGSCLRRGSLRLQAGSWCRQICSHWSKASSGEGPELCHLFPFSIWQGRDRFYWAAEQLVSPVCSPRLFWECVSRALLDQGIIQYPFLTACPFALTCPRSLFPALPPMGAGGMGVEEAPCPAVPLQWDPKEHSARGARGRIVWLDHLSGNRALFLGWKGTPMGSVSPFPKCRSATPCQLLPTDTRGYFHKTH